MKQNNNAGFSLVELLVSIVVLAVIMIPVLDNIVLSSRMNKQSKEKQEANTLVSNLMEATKSEQEVSSLAEELLKKEGMVFTDFFAGTDTTNVDIKHTELGGVHKFQVDNLVYGGQSYDVRITYDPTVYATDEHSINNQKIPVISSVSTKQNAVISEGHSDTWAASSLKHLYNQWFNTYMTGINSMTNEKIAESMNRKFKISLSYREAEHKYVVEGKIHYTLGSDLIQDTDAYRPYREYENLLFYSEFKELQSVYLFYYPNFIKKTDEILVENNLPEDKKNMTLYLVAQENKALSETQIQEQMKTYKVKLTVTDAHSQSSERMQIKNNIGLKDAHSGLVSIPKGTVIEEFVKKEAKTRLYQVKVEAFYGDLAHTYSEKYLVASMTSTKGVD